MQLVTERARETKVDSAHDVVVAGGGIAGVAAALAAARQGVKVALLEKQFGLGGLATLGHVVMYLPLCDGYGKQVMGGLAEELLHHSVAELKEALPVSGFIPLPECWQPEGALEERERKRFFTCFNPYAFQMAMERLLEQAGVEIMYDTRICEVLKGGSTISHVVVENKSGRLAIKGRVFIDASGDADVAFLAGCDVETYEHNVLAGWYYELRDGQLCLVKFTTPSDREHRGGGKAMPPFYSGTEHRSVTRHVLDTRRLLCEKLAERQAAAPDSAIYPFALPSIPALRITRRLRNQFSLGECHRHVWLEDSVGVTGDWRRRGPIYPLPYRALLSDQCPNLFAVGRCMSSDHTVIDVTRAIGTCAVTGEASGIAAGMMVKEGRLDGSSLDLPKLQEEIRRKGGLLSADLLRPHPKAQPS